MNEDIAPPADPWVLFADWYAQAEQAEPAYANAMILATVDGQGAPSARVVLMKQFDHSGIIFHTNRDSRKGKEMAARPQVSVCFYWKSLERQIRVEGKIAPVSDDLSDAYFASRPRASQIGAWASLQSQILASREEFEARIAACDKKFADQPVPRPPHWGGYRLTPHCFEFWQERLYRLHDRLTYVRNAEKEDWRLERLYP